MAPGRRSRTASRMRRARLGASFAGHLGGLLDFKVRAEPRAEHDPARGAAAADGDAHRAGLGRVHGGEQLEHVDAGAPLRREFAAADFSGCGSCAGGGGAGARAVTARGARATRPAPGWARARARARARGPGAVPRAWRTNTPSSRRFRVVSLELFLVRVHVYSDRRRVGRGVSARARTCATRRARAVVGWSRRTGGQRASGCDTGDDRTVADVERSLVFDTTEYLVLRTCADSRPAVSISVGTRFRARWRSRVTGIVLRCPAVSSLARVWGSP